jgi:predicted dithiol-disulfide oxidoreductase (DUF899 family)
MSPVIATDAWPSCLDTQTSDSPLLSHADAAECLKSWTLTDDGSPAALSVALWARKICWRYSGDPLFESDFNQDFHVTHTEAEWQSGATEYNYRAVDFRPAEESPVAVEFASRSGTDFATYRREGPGMSAFVLADGVVYHTYSAYARGLDGLWGMCQWLDRAPFGRNESGGWWRRHDEYDSP